jgi:2-amino-4-hydroxy-6-hydroxymethyldihydropteridine diphosphokinase
MAWQLPPRPCLPAMVIEALAAAPRFTAWVALGGNLGDVPATFRRAIAALRGLPSTHLLGVSALFETAPWEAQGPQYFNAVVALDTSLGPAELLRQMQAIEAEQGRVRPQPVLPTPVKLNAPRTLDLDLLSHGNRRSASAFLGLPHPRALQRAFVLGPWAELRQRLPADPWAPALPPAGHVAALCAGQGAKMLADVAWAD